MYRELIMSATTFSEGIIKKEISEKKIFFFNFFVSFLCHFVSCCVVSFFRHMCHFVSYWFDTTHLDSLVRTQNHHLVDAVQIIFNNLKLNYLSRIYTKQYLSLWVVTKNIKNIHKDKVKGILWRFSTFKFIFALKFNLYKNRPAGYKTQFIAKFPALCS